MANVVGDEQPWTRGYLGWLIDRGMSWAYGYPPEECNYKLEPVRIPVSSGLSRIELAATFYAPILPDGKKPKGTILARSPYGRGLPISLVFGRLFASRGYQVLIVSCRGTFGSGGEFDPFRDAVEDGKAVVEWMRTQHWYTGTFATLGASYLGFNQWALLADPNPPRDMVAAIIIVGPHDLGRSLWHTGALNMDAIAWGNQVSKQGQPNSVLKKWIEKMRHIDPFRPVLDSIPLVQGVNAALSGKVPWLETLMTTTDLQDPYYAPTNVSIALEQTEIPILLIGGWHDMFLNQTMEQYLRLHERGCNVALTMGPWDHNSSGFSRTAPQQLLGWLETYLAKKREADRPKPVHYYVTGAEEWHWASVFPPPTNPFTLYFGAENKLHSEVPEPSETTSSSFVFDPATPTPAVGGDLLRGKSGSIDDTVLSTRSDVLTFTTEPLEDDVEFAGKCIVNLAHSTDSPYADLFVRISEVDANGKSRNICDTYQRLDPERDMEQTITLQLRWCAHRFVKGKRIRLLVAGGSHPHYARNLGVYNPDNRGSEMKAVKHTVFHGPANGSNVSLPRC
jgi:putative CocE/NonD family hydrolase